MSARFEYRTSGRNRRTVAALFVFYCVLIGLIVVVQAAPWLMALLALVTLPALWDLYSNRSAGLSLDDARLSWYTGRRSAEIALAEIDHMRFDTRLDFSVRVSAVLHNEKRIRLPYEALPAHRVLEAAFEARNVRVERHHFTFF